ncbi:MAG: hypothetical protein RID91_03590 [Azospirillaceae bacterium]
MHGLFRPRDATLTCAVYDDLRRLRDAHQLDDPAALPTLALKIAKRASPRQDPTHEDVERVATFLLDLFGYEGLFEQPEIDWRRRRSVSEWWELRDQLSAQRALLERFEEVEALLIDYIHAVAAPVELALPQPSARSDEGSIVVPTPRLHALADLPAVVERVTGAAFREDIERAELLPHLRRRLEANLIAASGGNPNDPRSFTRAPRLPSKSDIRDPADLVTTYLGETPLPQLFAGEVDVAIPSRTRFEHHHIVAGSGHGKTQALQYLISEDLEAVARGERSIIVLDSQGDLIGNIARLKAFAPGEPLHDRMVLIDPTDVEYPVSLNLFDVGLERLDRYSQLDRERLLNSILELYDFVLGTLLAAEMTQKQSVIFRYVTRLMLQIPDATIHTLRELMEPGSHERFAEPISQLSGTARRFFETEFASKEFEQTKKQVLRRLWGILENQTFERMFSHPRSKLDLFAEMNAGKVILINTAKDLLKETGTEIFGRFFIALITQAAQERATLPEKDRTPTFVYIDEAADYFDRNIGIILSQARKYNVGLVLAHQYLGQLEPKLQEAIAANTAIKFAGGVSTKDARTLAPTLGCEPGLIEAQPKGSFAASIRGVTKGVLPLRFPFGHLEAMPRMDAEERTALQAVMRARYAIHYAEMDAESEDEPDSDAVDEAENVEETGAEAATDPESDPATPHQTKRKPNRDDGGFSTDASDTW